MNAIDPAFDRLQMLEPELKAALAARPNEADTRLKVLDRILFEVLEWKRDAVFAEPPTDSGYIDYLLTIGERRGAMVIEAKRNGKLAPATKDSGAMAVSLSGPVVRPLSAALNRRWATRWSRASPSPV
jgi:hypothetical protein